MALKASNSVFTRTGTGSTIGESAFYFILMLSVVWGLAVSAYCAQYAVSIKYDPGVGEKILIGLLIPLLGVIISAKSDHPVMSLLGYHMIVVPFGILLGPILQKYRADVVQNALYLTGTITIVMGLAGTFFPQLFRNMGTGLFMALLGLIIVRVLQIFIPAMAEWGWIEYIAAGIFSLYIAFDMARASDIDKTADNAIDVAVSLYLDIINLFLTTLGISDD